MLSNQPDTDPIQVDPRQPFTLAIQGELGSNSHLAMQELSASWQTHPVILPCATSAEVFDGLARGLATFAVLPIENSLHGSVFEHYDLLLEHRTSILAEHNLRIHHNVIAAPGVALGSIRRVLSHPVALAQCRRWLRAHPEIEVTPFYDTAGAVKHLLAENLRDTAAIAPALASEHYGAALLMEHIEDHPENYTRFYLLRAGTPENYPADADKASLAFSVVHRPGSLLAALEVFRDAGLNLTRIESRPVHGRPWHYVFFVDLRFGDAATLETALEALRLRSEMVEELGRYRAAD